MRHDICQVRMRVGKVLCLALLAGTLAPAAGNGVATQSQAAVVVEKTEVATATENPSATATATATEVTTMEGPTADVTATAEATAEATAAATAEGSPSSSPTGMVVEEASFFTVSDTDGSITAYTGDVNVTSLVIPKKAGGVKVKALDASILKELPNLKNVVLRKDMEVKGDLTGLTVWGKKDGKAESAVKAGGGTFAYLNGPETLKVKKKKMTKVRLQFDACEKAKEYEIQCQIGSGAFKKVGKTAETKYSQDGLSAGKKYTYRVRPVIQAENGDEFVGYFTKNSIVLGPAEVKNLKATGFSNGIQVRWKMNQNVDGYQVFMKVHVKGFQTGFNKMKTLNKNNITGYRRSMLVTGMKYSFRVRSFVKVNKKKIYSDFVTVTAKAG